MSGSTESRPTSRGHHAKAVFRGSVGNAVEWYDWFVYANFALYFAGQFFPEGDRTAQLMNTAAVFAVGFLARPLGGWLLGRVADRKGRKHGLTLSVTMMSCSALLIAGSFVAIWASAFTVAGVVVKEWPPLWALGIRFGLTAPLLLVIALALRSRLPAPGDMARVAVLGINPGRLGGGRTGIAFTDPGALTAYCGIAHELPRRAPELSTQFVYEVITELGGPVTHRREDQMGLGAMEPTAPEDAAGLDHQQRGVAARLRDLLLPPLRDALHRVVLDRAVADR